MSSFELYEIDDCYRSHAQIYMSIWLVDFHRDLSMRAHLKYIRVTNVIVLLIVWPLLELSQAATAKFLYEHLIGRSKISVLI